MKKKAVKAKFKILIEVFYMEMKKKLGYVKRDIEEFIKFNVTEQDITEIEEKLEAFADLPTDKELLGEQTEATTAKDNSAQKLRNSIDEIISRASIAFGIGSGKYRKFGVKTLSKIDGGELVICARRVRRVTKEFFKDLYEHGLTQEMVDAVKKDRLIYEQDLVSQEDAISNRDIATEERIEQANVIYDVISTYCATGRKIWEDTNEAKYNDYIIYDTVTNKTNNSVE